MNRKCDDLIETLLLFEEDMFHDRKYNEIMSSPEQISLKQEGTERHSKANLIPDDKIQVTPLP